MKKAGPVEVKTQRLGDIFVIDQAQRIVQWSEELAGLIGISSEDALGCPCYELVQGRDAFGRPLCGPRCPGLRALEQGRFFAGSTLVVQREGVADKRLRCELTAFPSPLSGAFVRLYEKELSRFAGIETVGKASLVSPTPFAEVAQDLCGVVSLLSPLSRASLRESLESSLGIIREACQADAVELFLREVAGQGMVLSHFCGPFKNAFFQMTRFRPGEGFPGILLASQEPILTRALPEDNRYLRTRVKEKGFHSYLCFPLSAPYGIMGSVNVAFRDSRVDLARVLTLISWASIPLSLRVQAGLNQLKELVSVDLVGRGDELAENLSELFSQILKRITSLGDAQGGVMNFLHRQGKGLAWRVRRGSIPAAICPALQVKAAQSCPALVELRSVVHLGSRAKRPVPCRQYHHLGSLTYCIPMTTEGERIGLLQLAYGRPGPEPPTRDLVMLEKLAEEVAQTAGQAMKYIEGTRRTGAMLRQLVQTEIDLSLKRGFPPPPELVKLSYDEGQGVALAFLEIRCFGSFELYRQGSIITAEMIPRRKAWNLLKILLAYEGRPLSKETLIELLWPETSPKAGAGRFNVVVHALRRVVEPPGQGRKWTFIQNDGDRYWFNTKASCRIDTVEFKAYVAIAKKMESRANSEVAVSAYKSAVLLYRGDFLEEELFADWCWAKREDLREIYFDTTKRLNALCVKAGNWEEGATYLRLALRIDPLREEFHRELIRCLWALGRRDEALRQYKICREGLSRELDVSPLPETEKLVQQIRRRPRL
ncbi:MAG: BTAD domain-containing putative transcriptional regulator [Thermodesulfobacteriota bacterium]